SLLLARYDGIGLAGESSIQPPGGTAVPLDAGAGIGRPDEPHSGLRTQASAPCAGPTGVLTQTVSIDTQHRILRFKGFDRSVVRVPVIDADYCALAVGRRRRPPASAARTGMYLE